MELTDKQIKDLVARRHPEYEKKKEHWDFLASTYACLLYTSPSPRDATLSRMPSSA